MSRYAPFPVEVPYCTGPTMTKLGERLRKSEDSGHLFVVDERYGAYLEQKLRHLSEHPEHCGGLSKGVPEGLEVALWRAFALIAEEQPALVQLENESVRLEALGIALRFSSTSHRRRCTVETLSEDAPLSALGQRVKAHLNAQPALSKLIHALALSIQEDFVILREIEGSDEAECLCVTFPSRWDPQAKVGQNFSEVHAPVANNGALLKAHRPVMNALFHKGPFVRFVWGLSADESLGQHPEYTTEPLPEEVLRSPETLASHLFFRTERQVSYPLPELNRCLFTVRVTMQPLKEALYSDERRQRLAASLASMDEELLAYKGLSAWREPLLEYLNAHSA